MRVFVIGAKKAAIAIWWGPTQAAWGIISPKNSTHVTEMIIASQDGKIASRKIGSASMHAALVINSVTSRRCLCLITLITLFARYFSCYVPVFSLRSIVKLSIDRYPTVNPLIIPAHMVKPKCK